MKLLEEQKFPRQPNENAPPLYSQLRKYISLIDELRDIGLESHILLPRIAVLGTQSSGKSSVLESIVGIDFLPKGNGIVTRRPLELRLHHISENIYPWAEFEEIKGVKFTDFEEVNRKIIELTEKVAGNRYNIVDKPITMKIFSNSCPDLTLIDLPGLTRLAVAGYECPYANIYETTLQMAKRYCADNRTIILCVIPANIDLTTSEALQLSLNWDSHQVRTIGVLTKIDLMDKGTNCKKVLLNQEVELKLGYVGVKNRSQYDLMGKVPIQKSLDEEKEWFEKHVIYKNLPKGYFGIESLVLKLSHILYAHIRSSLPEIIKEISEKLKSSQKRLSELGNPMPETELEKTHLLMKLSNSFILAFKSQISGKIDIRNLRQNSELFGGARIKLAFYNLFQEFSSSDYRVSENFLDKDIENALILHEGDQMSGFVSVDAFYYLISPEIEKLKEPALKCLQDVHYFLEDLSLRTIEKIFGNFPLLVPEIMNEIRLLLKEEQEKTKFIVESIIDSEIGYLFTNDVEYNGKYTDIFPRNEEILKNVKNIDPNKIFINEMRKRMDNYFRLVVRNIRDTIPKTIGAFLVKAIENRLQIELSSRLITNEQIMHGFIEPSDIIEERKTLKNVIETMKKSIKVMQKDPDFSASSNPTDEELIKTLDDLKKENKENSKNLQTSANFNKSSKNKLNLFG